jgi:hypothetical protein
MSERDELAKLLFTLPVSDRGGDTAPEIINLCDEAAQAILAAGYNKPRTVTTVEELDALPEGTTIVDQAERLTLEETSMSCLEWVDRHGNACHVELPATVLFTPEPTL